MNTSRRAHPGTAGRPAEVVLLTELLHRPVLDPDGHPVARVIDLVADDSDDRAIGAAAQVRFESQRFHALDDVLDLRVAGARLQNNDHRLILG